MNLLKALLISSFTLGLTAQAATVALGTSGTDPNNYGTFSGQTLTDITLNGKTYDTSELIQVTLTSWRGASTGQLLQYNGGPTNPDANTRRSFLETDWSGNTGIINPATSAGSAGFSFNSPVTNVAGADLFLYEITGATFADDFIITIDGNALTVGGDKYGDSGVSSNSADVLNFSSTPTTLNSLLTANTSQGSNNISQSIHGVGIDFSDFGITPGATVSSFTLHSTGANTFDPVIIAAIPEASSLWLLSLGFLTFALVKRRK